MDNNSQTNYAGFWLRWFAQGLDIVIWQMNLFVPLFLLSVLGSSNLSTFVPGFLWSLLYILFAAGLIKLFVHPYLVSRFGAGVGKLACGLEIVKEDGKKLTYKNALFRDYIAKTASNALLGVGYYWIFKNAKKQAWHDMLSGTYVVKKRQGLFIGILALMLFLGIEAGLAYKTYDNYKNNKTLQFDIITLITQIQQDQAPIQVNQQEVLF